MVQRRPIYYIRSSVLGGEVVSEADGTGRKKKTFVIAAGAKIATQSQYTYNNSTNQTVNWEHTDASGMSYRSTMNTGGVAYGDGQFEGQPAEMDPMGGKTGMETPYIEVLLDPPPPDDNFPFFQIADDSPMYVNGQRVSCTLDGMSVGCSMAMQALESGSAIPAALAPYQGMPGFSFESRGLGIFSVSIPRQVGWNVTYGPNDGPNGTAQPIYNGTNTYGFSVSWGHSSPGNGDIVRIELPVDFKDRIKERLGSGDCNTFIAKLISDARQFTTTKDGEVVKRSSLNPDRTGHEEPYAPDGYDLLKQMQGFVLEDNLKVGNQPVGGTTLGSIPDKNATAVIRSMSMQKPGWRGWYRGYEKYAMTHAYEFYTGVAVHEMVHLAGYNWNDDFLAVVLHDIRETKALPSNRVGDTASDQLNDVLKKHCPGGTKK